MSSKGEFCGKKLAARAESVALRASHQVDEERDGRPALLARSMCN
jgi:hypothetical protein